MKIEELIQENQIESAYRAMEIENAGLFHMESLFLFYTSH